MCKDNVTESRSHEVEKDLLESLSPTPLSKQGQLHQVAHDCVQLGFEYL